MSKEYWKPGCMLYPVPAVMVSCGREGGKPNIITVAWAGTICSDPAMVSISIRKERFSHGIIKETGEFVINLVNKPLVRATDYCGVKSGRDVDKFKEMRLTPQASRYVKAPGIEESPVNIECKVKEVKELGSHDMFIAQVVGVTIDNQYMNDKGKFNLNTSGLVSYSHGEYYELGKKLGSFGYSVKKPVKKKYAGTAGDRKHDGTSGDRKHGGIPVDKKHDGTPGGKKHAGISGTKRRRGVGRK